MNVCISDLFVISSNVNSRQLKIMFYCLESDMIIAKGTLHNIVDLLYVESALNSSLNIFLVNSTQRRLPITLADPC